MKHCNQFVFVAALTAIALGGCNEWQDLKSGENYQDACENSGGVFDQGRCHCSNSVNSINDINDNCQNGTCKCDEGVICVINDGIKGCAGRTGDNLIKMCESSG